MTFDSTKKELLKILNQYDLKAQKKFGQNFLINESILNSIIQEAELEAKDYVVEVGPGLGILTTALAEKAHKIDSIELDNKLLPYLKEKFKQFPQVNLINQDALKFSLPHDSYKLIANIPYYITSPLLTHFLFPKKEMELRPTLVVLLVQKEVADKICVKEGEHTILSLQVQIFGKPQIVKKVPPNAFYPEPKVDSAILKIKTYSTPLIDDPELFFKIIKITFSHRRKTLLNSLSSGLKLNKEIIGKILEESKINSQERPQDLKIEDWQRLIDILKNNTYPKLNSRKKT